MLKRSPLTELLLFCLNGGEMKESHQCGDIAKKSLDGCPVSVETVEQRRVTLSRVTYELRTGGGKLCTQRFLSSADTRCLSVITKYGCI